MIILNKLLKFFSAFVVFFITACETTVEDTPTAKQPSKEMGQVIIAEGISKKNNQAIPQQKNEIQPLEEENEENIKEQNKEETKKEETKEEDKKEKGQEKEISKESPKEKYDKPKTSSFLNWGESQYWAKLKTAAEIASSFYQNNGTRFTLLSKEGKLYNNSTDSYVTTNYLMNHGFLEEDFSDFPCDILLIKGSDIDEVEVPSSSLNVGIFTAIRQPSGNKVMISSAKEKIGIISEENYQRLLKKYNVSYGAVKKLSPNMEEYERILNFIRVYEGNYDNYYVRDIRMDKKYAVVTFSTKNTTSNVKQYVLVNEDGFWEVAISNLDTQSNLDYAVNSVLPDFNLSLLPPYNISFYKNDMLADFSEILKSMIFYELIEQQTQVEYICATTNYCYIVLYGGEKYLGKKQNENWDIKKVKSSSDAINSMELDNKNAPTFIVLDEERE